MRELAAAILLVALTPEIDNRHVVLEALLRLKDGDDAEDVQQIMKALIPKLQQCRNELKQQTRHEQTTGDTQQCLQRLGSSEEVERLLATVQDGSILRKVDRSFGKLRRRLER